MKEIKPTNILYVIGQLNYGGAERQLYYLIKELDKERYRPILCVLSDFLEMLPLFQKDKIPVYHFKRCLPRSDVTRFIRLVRLIKKIKPNLVHSYLLTANIYSCLAGIMTQVPVIISERNVDPYKIGESNNFDRMMERLVYPISTALIANSKAGGIQIRERTGITEKKIHVVFNGLESENYQSGKGDKIRREFGLTNGFPIIGIVGSHVGRRKDLATFFRAMKHLSSRYRQEFRILCVGTGPKHKEIVSLAKELGLRERTIFTGFRADIPDLMAVMDLLVSSSQREGMPNVVMEAMAAGKPVVATAVGGTPELVIHGETGLLVPSKNPQAMAEAIFQVVKAPEQAICMGEAGRRRIQQHFNIESMVQGTERIYKNILRSYEARHTR